MVVWYRKIDSAGYEIAELIISVVIPMIYIVIGTLGNLISIVILLEKESRRSSTHIYLIFLCLVDTISLYQWNLGRAFYTFANGQPIWGKSLIMCKLTQFFAFYTLHTSAMFLTFVELDRSFLLRSRWYKNKVARPILAWIVCSIILISLFGIDGILLGLGMEYSVYNNLSGMMDTTVACYSSWSNNVMDYYNIQFPWIHLVIMYFLPFSVIIVCTCLTITKLIVQPVSVNIQLARSAQRNRRISLMLLCMCLTYVICTLPNRLCFSLFMDQIVGHDYTDALFLATNTLMYTRNALNIFFLYVSVKAFRKSMFQIFMKCFGRGTTSADAIGPSQIRNGIILTTTPAEEQHHTKNHSCAK